MSKTSHLMTHLRYMGTSTRTLMALFALSLIAIAAGFVTLGSQPALAADCNNNNDIICGGVSSAADFTNKFAQNAPGDLPAIYAHYGLGQDQISQFANRAVEGVSNKNGTIVVGGKTVATNAYSVGRRQKSGDHAVTIAGKTYWEGSNQTAFGHDSLPTLVLMNGDQFVGAVIKSCGNAEQGTPTAKAPSYTCNMLSSSQTSRTEFHFTTDATATNGAKIDHYVYDFGDGKSEQTTDTSISHTYQNDGTYTVKVTVYVTVNGETVPVAGPRCIKQVVVKPVPTPPAQPVCAINPSLPAGSPDCAPCQVPGKETLPKGSPDCVETPKAPLPSTGPEDFIAPAMGATTLSGAGYYWFRSRRELIARALGK